MKENCIRCGKPTPYEITSPVTERKYYVDGSGQLCEECWRKLYGSEEFIKTIKITSPGSIPPDKQEQYNALKERYTILTQKEARTDADREEMEELIRRAKELYSSTNSP